MADMHIEFLTISTFLSTENTVRHSTIAGFYVAVVIVTIQLAEQLADFSVILLLF
jgi:hypothetical protein